MRMQHLLRLALILAFLTGARLAAAAPELPALFNEYRGQVVVVDFWASWCVPCRRSFPWLNEMQKKYAADGLVIVGVNEDNDQREAAAFLAEVPADFRIVPDPDGQIASQFDLLAMPTSFLIDRDGVVIENHLGFKVAKTGEYEAALRRALGLASEIDTVTTDH
ncbi:MAG: TlpA disulfide reductase family protein [Woeseia sp.]